MNYHLMRCMIYFLDELIQHLIAVFLQNTAALEKILFDLQARILLISARISRFPTETIQFVA